MSDKNKVLMIDLNEDGLDKISEVLANKTCRKILNLLADNELTHSQIAKELGISLSLAQYNIDKLVESNLVTSDKFHYSKKGRTIKHYSLANKHILISPKKITGIKSKLKTLLPIGILGVGIVAILGMFNLFMGRVGSNLGADKALKSSAEASPMLAEIATETTNSCFLTSEMVLSFLAGILFVTLVYYIIKYFIRRKKK
ncbi:winged helix-turn-helix domain-containing protein [Candidatus Woesearchaeota archaeon]|nr:winged helix-turn-helix domain-containing protein [Candidatus Woesearchaeota archaeon]